MKSKFWTILIAFTDLILGTGGAFLLNALLESDYELNEKWVLGIILLIIAFFLFAINTLILSKMYDILVFLRRWFSPEKYIEGTWVQIIDDSSLRTIPPTKYTIITIKIENCIHTIKVNTYDQTDGKEVANIKISYSEFDVRERKLEYHYKLETREFSLNKQWIGFAKLTFDKTARERCFNKYSGIIISNLPRANEIRVRAFKHLKKIKLSNGKKKWIDNESIKCKEIRDYIDKHIKEIF
jgi:hypothetical protein